MRFIAIILFCFLVFISCKSPKDSTSYELKIVYNYLHDTLGGEYEIYRMNLDGSEKKNLSNSLYSNDWVYYTYKDRIFFISDRDTTLRTFFLYEMDTEGKNVRKISNLRLHDSWMSSRRDGKELIVSARGAGKVYYQLYLINTETGRHTQLTHDTAAMYTDPLFSPDGQQVFFRYRKHRMNMRVEKEELWRLDFRDSSMHQITHYPASDTSGTWFSHHAGPPKWHQGDDGTFVSFSSFQNKRNSLYRVSPNGGESLKIFADKKYFVSWHDWSPDGKWLVLDMYDNIQTEFDIYLVNWETREVKQLTDHIDLEQAPSFVQVKSD